MSKIFQGPLFDEPETDEIVAPDEPTNALALPGPLKNPGELEALERAYRSCKHLPEILFDVTDAADE
jgi:hypothetical protein